MDHSKILQKAYQQFLLPLGGKKVPAPYRKNTPFQPDRSKYGKSNSATLAKDTIEIAREKDFNLESASVEEIRKFMEENWLGIDCSGLAYHLLDDLLKEIGKGGMQEIGFPKASSTNVAKLTEPEFSHKIINWDLVQSGDLIRLNSEDADHVLIVVEAKGKTINYAHSSGATNPTGVHRGEIVNGQFPEDLKVFNYNEKAGDGIFRLRALS